MKRVRFDGAILAEWDHWRLCADRLSAAELLVPQDISTPGDPRREVLVATMHDSTALYWFNEDIALDLPEPKYAIALENLGNSRWALTLTAETLLKDLCIFVDRLAPDAEISDMLVTLLPGQSHRFIIEKIDEIYAEAIPSVVRCANQLLR